MANTDIGTGGTAALEAYAAAKREEAQRRASLVQALADLRAQLAEMHTLEESMVALLGDAPGHPEAIAPEASAAGSPGPAGEETQAPRGPRKRGARKTAATKSQDPVVETESTPVKADPAPVAVPDTPDDLSALLLDSDEDDLDPFWDQAEASVSQSISDLGLDDSTDVEEIKF